MVTVIKQHNAHRCAIVQHRSEVVGNMHGVAFVGGDDRIVALVPRIDFLLVHVDEDVAVCTHVLVPEANRVTDLMHSQAELRKIHAF